MIFRRKRKAAPLSPSPASTGTAPATTAAPQTEPANLPRKKVLVVDDDPVIVQSLSCKLQSQGYAVITAADGSQALNATRSEKPDLMLLDVNLPPDVSGVAWNGFLITQWLRRLEAAKNTPVILISATDRVEYKQRASAVGAAAFLPKPIDSSVLLASIETALYRKPDFEPANAAPNRTSQEAARTQDSVAASAPESENEPDPMIEFGL